MADECCTIDKTIADLKEDNKEQDKAQKELNTKIEAIKQENAVSKERYQQILTAVNELKQDAKELKEKPAKRWEQLMSIVLQWAVLGLLAAAVVFK